jgi:hypothetical protein
LTRRSPAVGEIYISPARVQAASAQAVDWRAGAASGIALASIREVLKDSALANGAAHGGKAGRMNGEGEGAEHSRQSELVLNQLRAARMVSPGVVVSDRRRGPDRRRVTLWSLLYGGVRPRRRTVRREVEHSVSVVDWHDSHLLAVAVGILLLSSADAYLTLTLLMLGAQEANPVMAKLIYFDVTWFPAVKIGLTGFGVVVLVTLSRCKVFGRFKVVSSLYFTLAFYAALVLYELALRAHLT